MDDLLKYPYMKIKVKIGSLENLFNVYTITSTHKETKQFDLISLAPMKMFVSYTYVELKP